MNDTDYDNQPEVRLALLATEIRFIRNGLVSDIDVRKVHPTYGRTKAGLREKLAHLEGALYAYGVLTTDGGTAHLLGLAQDTAEILDIDLRGLRAAVKAS